MRRIYLLVFALLTLKLAGPALGQKLPPGITVGPSSLSLGAEGAKLDLPKAFLFADTKLAAENFTKAQEPLPSGLLGLVTDAEPKVNWFAPILYDGIGHISDDDAGQLFADRDKVLDVIKQKTQEEYAKMPAGAHRPPTVLGWYRPPIYNRATHTMTWGMVMQEDGEKDQTVNLTVAVLGRYGMLQYTAVGQKADSAYMQAKLDQLNPCIRFEPGRDYNSWVESDGRSGMSLTTLVTGGAAAAVVAKTGILGKLGSSLIAILLALKKAIILVIAGIASVFRKIKNALTRKNSSETAPNDPVAPTAGAPSLAENTVPTTADTVSTGDPT